MHAFRVFTIVIAVDTDGNLLVIYGVTILLSPKRWINLYPHSSTWGNALVVDNCMAQDFVLISYSKYEGNQMIDDVRAMSI